MNDKLKKHMEDVFRDIPRTSKAAVLQEKLSGKLNEKYVEFLESGKSPDEAADMAILEMKDMECLLKTLEEDEGPENEKVMRYRRKSARLLAAAVVLYILGTGIWFMYSLSIANEKGEITPYFGQEGLVAGIFFLFAFYAAATGLLIYRSHSVERYAGIDKGEEQEKKRQIRNVRYILWPAVMLSFAVISFIMKNIHTGVLVFMLLAGVVLERIIVVVFLKKKRAERHRDEILSTPLEKFYDKEAEDIAKKYEDNKDK